MNYNDKKFSPVENSENGEKQRKQFLINRTR